VKRAPSHEPKPGRKRSAATEAFFRSDGAHDGPLVVVYHIQKTAGTALRHFVRRNLPPSDVESVPDLRALRHSPHELRAWYRQWYESLGDDRRARLCCVMSHVAGYLLPVLDRPADALVLVREPVDRTLSYYHAKQRRAARRSARPLESVFEDADRGRLSSKRDHWEQFFNWQSRCLLSVFDDVSQLPITAGPPADADVWRGRLRDMVDRVFLVGTQDRFGEYVDALARRFGWQPFVARSKVNEQRPATAELPSDVREAILAYNWLDVELYELARRAQEARAW
jgi:hypothetical protein